ARSRGPSCAAAASHAAGEGGTSGAASQPPLGRGTLGGFPSSLPLGRGTLGGFPSSPPFGAGAAARNAGEIVGERFGQGGNRVLARHDVGGHPVLGGGGGGDGADGSHRHP